MRKNGNERVLIDGSRIVIEAMARAGAEVYVGYPITPANWLYAYAERRFPLSLPAPDEITALQWAAGFSAAGRFPVTATSFPGFALMLETLNMAFMMELPMVIVLAQRMGPSTGSATTGAQGDLLLLRGAISGGYAVPVLCPSDLSDCWVLGAESIATALRLRTPVVLLTSKEMIMTNRSFDLSRLPDISPPPWPLYEGDEPYVPYEAGESMVPPFLPVGNGRHQVRLNASTHDETGLIQKAAPRAVANTARLRSKIEKRVAEFAHYEYDEDTGTDTLVVTYGITSDAARDAVKTLRSNERKTSLLILKTLLPVPPVVRSIIDKHDRVVVAEENLSGSLREMLFGQATSNRIHGINKIGSMIEPGEIVEGVEACQEAS